MFDWIQTRILSAMRVPAEPHPPDGSAGSVRIFRAGRNYFRFRVLTWLLSNAAALAGQVAGYFILERIARKFPPWAQQGTHGLELLVLAVFLASLPITFLQQRLNFQMRWYIVTDRSLRVRNGIWSTHELTSTFANIQEIRVSAGPLQKLLGLADVEAHSAGGGSSGPHGSKSGHIARFEGLDNANEIRDYLVDSLRQYRDSGLGEAQHAPALASTIGTVVAAEAVLEETRRLRLALQQA